MHPLCASELCKLLLYKRTLVTLDGEGGTAQDNPILILDTWPEIIANILFSVPLSLSRMAPQTDECYSLRGKSP